MHTCTTRAARGGIAGSKEGHVPQECGGFDAPASIMMHTTDRLALEDGAKGRWHQRIEREAVYMLAVGDKT